MSTMTIRYPDELEAHIEKLMLATNEATKNGAINAAIRNYGNLLADIQDLRREYDNLLYNFNELRDLLNDYQTLQVRMYNWDKPVF